MQHFIVFPTARAHGLGRYVALLSLCLAGTAWAVDAVTVDGSGNTAFVANVSVGGSVTTGGVVAQNITVARAGQAGPTEVVRGDDARLVPVGSLMPFAGATPPTGWLLCDGAVVNRGSYPVLFAVIGVTYGAGDGASTFGLPDLRSRVAVGTGQGPGFSARALGQQGGEEAHQLTIAEMPAHNHGVMGSWYPYGPNHNQTTCMATGGPAQKVGVDYAASTSLGGDAPHNIMQPFLVINYIIKY